MKTSFFSVARPVDYPAAPLRTTAPKRAEPERAAAGGLASSVHRSGAVLRTEEA